MSVYMCMYVCVCVDKFLILHFKRTIKHSVIFQVKSTEKNNPKPNVFRRYHWGTRKVLLNGPCFQPNIVTSLSTLSSFCFLSCFYIKIFLKVKIVLRDSPGVSAGRNIMCKSFQNRNAIDVLYLE